jgi:hypothetical protein
MKARRQVRHFKANGIRLLCHATLLSATVLAGASSAVAQPTAADRTLAETLFDEGQKLMEAGKYAEACPKLAESQRLDPATGTLLNLGVCHEKQGKTASAWMELKEAAAMARRDGRADRVKVAEERAAAIEPSLSRVIINVPPAAAKEGLEIRFDDTVVAPAAWGVAMPADPGTHQVRVSAPGTKIWQTTIEVGPKNDSKEVIVPALEDKKAAAAPTGRFGGQMSTPPASGSNKTVGYVIGGVGIVSLGVGSVFGLQAISKSNDAKDACAGTCTQSDVDKMSQAKTAAWISNVGIGLGVVGIGVGAYLLFKPEHSDERSGSTQVVPLVGSSGGGVLVQRTW